RGLRLPPHPQLERLDAQQDLRGAAGGEGGAEVVDALGAGQHQVGGAAVLPVEGVGEHDPAEAGGGLGEGGPAAGPGGEVEGAAVHDHAGDRGAVAAEVLGGGVDHDVGPVLERAQQHRGGHRVVDDDGHAGGVGD